MLRLLRRADDVLAAVESAALCLLLAVLAAGGVALVIEQNAGPEGTGALQGRILIAGLALAAPGALASVAGLASRDRREGALFQWGTRALLLGALTSMVAGALHLDNAVDYLLRSGVLWIGLIGASLATRLRKHITIEALEKVLPARAKRGADAVIALTAMAILAVLFSVSLEYVGESRDRAEVMFTFRESGEPFLEWWVKVILPIGIAGMFWRFALTLIESVSGVEMLPPPETVSAATEEPAP